MHDTNTDDLTDRLNALIRLTIAEAAEVAQLIRNHNAEIHDRQAGDGSPVDQQDNTL